MLNLEELRKSFKNKQHFNHYVLASKKGKKKTFKKDLPGVPRLIQTLCLMNRIATSFASFWLCRNSIRKSLYRPEHHGTFSDKDRLVFEQQHYVVSYFLKDVVPEKGIGREEYLLACAQHMMKVLHAGLIIQSIFAISTSGGLCDLVRISKEKDVEEDAKDGLQLGDLSELRKVSMKANEQSELNAMKISELCEILREKEIIEEDFEEEIEKKFYEKGREEEFEYELLDFYNGRNKLIQISRKKVAGLLRQMYPEFYEAAKSNVSSPDGSASAEDLRKESQQLEKSEKGAVEADAVEDDKVEADAVEDDKEKVEENLETISEKEEKDEVLKKEEKAEAKKDEEKEESIKEKRSFSLKPSCVLKGLATLEEENEDSNKEEEEPENEAEKQYLKEAKKIEEEDFSSYHPGSLTSGDTLEYDKNAKFPNEESSKSSSDSGYGSEDIPKPKPKKRQHQDNQGNDEEEDETPKKRIKH